MRKISGFSSRSEYSGHGIRRIEWGENIYKSYKRVSTIDLIRNGFTENQKTHPPQKTAQLEITAKD